MKGACSRPNIPNTIERQAVRVAAAEVAAAAV
jgi:hypothetical protein